MAPYLYCSASDGTKLKAKIFEASCRRVYTSPNTHYSAAVVIPQHRKNIKCLTTTAGAAFTLTLPSLIDVEDGHKIVFQDTEGTAATNNVTLDGSGSETIKNGASTATTLVLSTNYFSITLRADVGADCWVVE